MKVKLYKETKRNLTISELSDVRQIQADLKSNGILEDYIDRAVFALTKKTVIRLFDTEVYIARNNRVNNYYTETSGTLDVWVTAQVLVYGAFLDIGFFLSDVWTLGRKTDNVSQEHFKMCAWMETYIQKSRLTEELGII